MKVKRILTILVALAMIVSSFTFIVSADEGAILTVSSVQACRGDEVEVTIDLKNNPGMALLGFELNYDASAVTLMEVANGEVFAARDFQTPAIGEASTQFLAYTTSADVTADGKLATFKFAVKGNAAFDISDITISDLECIDINENAIDVDTVDGTIEVYDPNGPILEVVSANNKPLKGFRGRTIEVAVEVKNNPGVAVVGFDFAFNGSVFSFESENYHTLGTVFSEDCFFEGNSAKNPYKVTFCDGDANVTVDGKLITFKFKIADDAPEGFYPFTIKNIETYTHDEETVRFAGLTGVVEVKSVEPGDVTEDGIVNRQDLLRLAKYFAGWQVEICEDAADVTGDGQVNRQDLLRLAKYFAGWQVTLG